MKKRILGMLLAVCLLLSMMPVSALAAEEVPSVQPEVSEKSEPIAVQEDAETPDVLESSAQPVEKVSMTYVNPLYADVIRASELVQPGAVALADEVVYCATVEEAGDAVRTQLQNRQETVTVGLQDSYMDKQQLTDVFRAALVHTGVPTAGDYLAWQYGGWSGSIGGYTQNNVYYLTLTYTVTYYTTAAQEAELDTAVSELLSDLELDQKSDYETVKAIYDWICANVTYDDTNLNDEDYKLKYTAYAAMMNHTAVCQGYAVLLYRLLLEEGIDVRVITGDAGGAHAWNIVRLGGRYYNADPTWDAGRSTYSYFLKNMDGFSDHTRSSAYTTEAFNAAYPMGETDFDPDAEPPEPADVTSGACGPNLTWTLDENGLLTISGTGEMEDYLGKDSPWNAYRELILTLEILNGVTSISGGAFPYCTNLTDVVIPESVTSIGVCAFQTCSNLTNLTMQEGLISIGENAFHQCSSLTSVTIPNSVTTIDNGAFSECGLRSVIIPEKVSDISGVFMGCVNLTNVILPEYITSIGGSAFDCCTSLSNIVIPDSVTWIGANAFSSCTSLTDIAIPQNVTNIYPWAFSGCSNLKKIAFAGNAPIFGDGTTDVAEIFDGVTATVYYPSYDQTWTEEVRQDYGGTLTWVPYGDVDDDVVASGTCGENLTWILDENGNLTISGSGTMYEWNSATEVPWYSYAQEVSTVTIESGVTSVGPYAFYRYENLGSVDLPESMISIGRYAFLNCVSLTDVVIPDGVNSIEVGAFSGCGGLTNITLPDTVLAIREYAFYACGSLTSVTIPASVTTIGAWAFSDCTNLNEITFCGHAPSSTYSSTAMFENVVATVYYPVNDPSWTEEVRQSFHGTLTWVAYKPSGTCGDNLTWTLDEDGVLTISGTGDMTDFSNGTAPWSDYQSDIVTIVLGDEVTSIGQSAFQNCSNLADITITDSVTSIGSRAFATCTKLVDISIPNSVTEIGEAAFLNCTSLESIMLPDYVDTFGSNVFYQCYALERVELPYGAGSNSDMDSVFGHCISLKYVTIPETVTELFETFYDCPSLQEIIFKGSAPIISNNHLGRSTATAYYPIDDPSWTEDVRRSYGENITWIPYLPGESIVAHGICGENLTWTLNDSGMLTISGTGEMMDYAAGTSSTFSLQRSITEVVIQNGVTGFGDYAFSDYAVGTSPWFDFRESITEIVIQDGVTRLGAYAFSDCAAVSRITFEGAAPAIGENCFRNVTAAVRYPVDDATWTDAVQQGYGGEIVWAPYVEDESQGESMPMYRLYNPYTLEHLLTCSAAEANQLMSVGWLYDGVAWNSPKTGSPVYRLYNPYDDWHTYTISQEEIDMLTPLGWKVDGVVCFAASAEDGLPIYRLFNPYEQKNYHLLTASIEERDWLVTLGWKLEGIGWYAEKR